MAGCTLALALGAVACGGDRGPAADAPRAQADPLTAASLMEDIAWLVDPKLEGRGSFQSGGRAAADRVAAEFARAGLDVVRQPISGGADNVLGVLRGGRKAVIVSAHYDHLGVDEHGVVYAGADDNASGVAVMLALARAAASRKAGHTIIFAAFGAEEAGLVGSSVYVRDPLVPMDRTVALINFDMVGRRFFEAGSGRDATAAVVGLEGDPGVRRATRRAARAAGLQLVEAPARLAEVFGFHDRTDDWWFRREGILAIHFSTGLHDDYHRATDTADKLAPEQMERIANAAYGLLVYLAGGGNRP